MGKLIKRWIPFVFFVLIPGIIVLASYLMPTNAALTSLRDTLVEWAVIVAAFAFLLGLLNVLRVHGNQISHRRQGWFYSLVLIIAMLLAWIPPTLQSLPSVGVALPIPIQTVVDDISSWLFKYLISPLGSSLAGLVVFTLALAAFRMLRVRPNAGAVLFLLIVSLTLLGTTPFIGLEWLSIVRNWLVNVWAMAGMRGLLLGVALGTLITALRVFIASEQPYSES